MPDLNSVPHSPLSLAASRRQSANMAPPPPPVATSSGTAAHQPAPTSSPSLNILPSNQNTVSHGQLPSELPPVQLASSQPSTQPQPPTSAADASSASAPGPGPLRHPRPLTASELHMQLEKEQEAVVNRLTRELSLLRAAQNASVVSNASSTSASASNHDPIGDSSLLSGSSFTIPTTRRHHRTSSSTSLSHPGQLASSYEARQHARPQAIPMSRQDSSTSRRSQANSPAPQGHSLDPSNYFQQQRVPPPSSIHVGSVSATPVSASGTDQLSPGLMPATMRYEETAYYRHELEAAKKENETLKRRIRELERTVRERRASDASRTRSESVSTTASVNVGRPGGASIAGPRESSATQIQDRERRMNRQSIASVAGSVGVGVPEEEVKVGESAASAGLGNASHT